jgi:hypothetical protein
VGGGFFFNEFIVFNKRLNGSLKTYKYGFLAKMPHKKLACLDNATCSTFEIRMKFYHGQKSMIVVLNVHHMYKS